MLTSIDFGKNQNNKTNIAANSKTDKCNILPFKTSEMQKKENREKAINAINERASKLHW